ncbi:MAG: RidA family protein [Rhodospirillales bacterium]|nr:RidA family protein [Rhodospirillales bacterium]MDE2197513.1 RidA family protein [Rhodospirillales bacterium]MDE2575714.1 RidA family protein [Rhodospirillales bacterium]
MLTVLQPPSWPRPKGYANAMMGTGTFVLVSGQIGWDAQGRFADGLVAQTAQALRNILAILAEAKAGPEHIARLVWYVTDIEAYRASGAALGAAWRDVMGRNFPAMAVIGVSALVEREACVEIEAVAILPA